MTDKTFEKYRHVIDEWFVNGFNGAKAYQKFYPKARGKTAKVKFSELVTLGNLQNYIQAKHEAVQKKLQTSHDALLKELKNWAYYDITQTLLLTPEQIKELPEDIRRLITKFETTTKTYTIDEEIITETVVKLWFVSKERAMEMIHKHTGFYEKDNSQKAPPAFVVFDARRDPEIHKK